MSARTTLLTAVRAEKKGAFEYLPKPFDLDELLNLVSSTFVQSRINKNQDINNLLGSFGSNIADPVHLSLGMSYLVIVLILFVWSWRLVFNVSKEKILSRVFFIPIPFFSIFSYFLF